MEIPKTSLSHPLQIAQVAAPGGGTIGITFCPGKRQDSAFSGVWRRDLKMDIAVIRSWQAEAVLTLVTATELQNLHVQELGTCVQEDGMAWFHLPIVDVSIPAQSWEVLWANARTTVHDILARQGRVVVHCKGGLGRAGTIAARILVERGVPAETAMAAVRAVRPGAIETHEQEDYVRSVVPMPKESL